MQNPKIFYEKTIMEKVGQHSQTKMADNGFVEVYKVVGVNTDAMIRAQKALGEVHDGFDELIVEFSDIKNCMQGNKGLIGNLDRKLDEDQDKMCSFFENLNMKLDNMHTNLLQELKERNHERFGVYKFVGNEINGHDENLGILPTGY